jgi:hypothetical protein
MLSLGLLMTDCLTASKLQNAQTLYSQLYGTAEREFPDEQYLLCLCKSRHSKNQLNMIHGYNNGIS